VLAQAGVKLSVSVIGRELDLGIVFVRVELKIPVRVFAEEDGGGETANEQKLLDG